MHMLRQITGGGVYSKSFESANKKYKYINLTYIQNDIK